MKSYYENLDERINNGDMDAIDEAWSLREDGNVEALKELARAKAVRESHKTNLIFGSRCGRTQFCREQADQSLLPIVWIDFDPRKEEL